MAFYVSALARESYPPAARRAKLPARPGDAPIRASIPHSTNAMRLWGKLSQ